MDSYIQKPNDYGAGLRTTALATVGSHCPTSISLPELPLITLTFFWVKEVFLTPPAPPPPEASLVPAGTTVPQYCSYTVTWAAPPHFF